MQDAIESEKRGSLTLSIYQDTDAQSPDEYGDDSLFLVANHRDFYVKPPKESSFESVCADYKKTHHVFGLEAYIHSGVVLALSNEGKFPDRQWDVSQLGAVFVAKEHWKTKASARHTAESYIEEWNKYLSGDVYGYSIEDAKGEHVASCWGFYGLSEALKEGRAMLAYEGEKMRKKALARKRVEITRRVPLMKRTAYTI